MKKSGKRIGRTQKKRPKTDAPETVEPGRRSILRMLGMSAGGLAVAGAGGYWAGTSFQAHAREHDLGRVGRGVPSIVQVHDPQCPDCTVLQRATRQALKCFEEDELVYVVASLTTDAGSIFAGRFGAGRVTLLLFDGEGRMQNISAGIRDHETLKAMFTQHIAQA